MGDKQIIPLVPSYAENMLIVDPECAQEIVDIVTEGGYYVRFEKDYEARLKQLFTHREKAYLVNNQWFEHLKHTNHSMYSMHLANIGNMRILYVLGRHIVFLCAFKEKEGRGKKRQSYVQYVPVAEKRLEQYKEVLA